MNPVKFIPVFLILVSASVLAESRPADNPTRYDYYRMSYQLNDDGTHVETRAYSLTILKQQVVERVKQISISHSTSVQKAEVLEAYTRKADGRRLDAPKNNFQVEVNKGRNGDSPIYSDMTTLTVVFPEVAVGDTLVFSYKIIQSEPIFPGRFSTTGIFPRTFEYGDVTIRIDMPESLWAQYEARDMAEHVEQKNGRKVIEWTLESKQPVKTERRNYSIFDAEQEPGFSFSTFRSYADIAEAYGARARAKAAVTERVRKLANEITAGKTTPRAQARALYDWVATNISYAGNCIGVGAVVPRDISVILDNLMGDCKDHATLLQALLAAKGIESTQALINAGNNYRLPKIPVVSTVNHVINYIPSLDLYVDSTAATIPFGMLPHSIVGKQVLLVDGYSDSSRTPIEEIGVNQQHMKTVAKIGTDGSLKGHTEISYKGQFAANTRAWMRNITNEQAEMFVKSSFEDQGLIGSGSIDHPDAKALLDTYNYKINFEMQDFVQRPGAGAFTIGPLFYSEAPVMHYASAAVEPVEDVDVACSNGFSSEEYVFELPAEMTILALPDDVSLANDFLSYRANHELRGNTLTIKRVFDDRTPSNICSPEMSREFRDFAKKVMPNVRAQVVYK